MAITRRQFVTRLGALAAAAGFSQVEATKIMDAVAYQGSGYGGSFGKPRVVWLHGAECTGCSTSLLGIFENVNGVAVEGTSITTAAAAIDAGILPVNNGLASGNNFTLTSNGLSPDPDGSMNIADVVIDVIDLLYHETVMGMGGDVAYKWLEDFAAHNSAAFVLVVEGAMQVTGNGTSTGGGAWSDYSSSVPWCSIARGATSGEITTAEMVAQLASSAACIAVIPIGQCAAFGGYPGCKPPISTTAAGFDTSKSQTGALGVGDFLSTFTDSNATYQAAVRAAAAKVVNVPGCPTNPWWFVLTVVCFLVDLTAVGLGAAADGTNGPLGILKADSTVGARNAGLFTINSSAVDSTGRLLAVYGTPIHGPKCPRYSKYTAGIFAAKPGDPGCLQKIGCKGPSTNSLCGAHGWNGQQPTNPVTWDQGVSHVNGTALPTVFNGGHCPRAGHPCMACTEKGYPDSFVPFVVRS
jgi:Ni,Fe-hydrogenase I small subunit